MTDGGPMVEIGVIQLQSWEHAWETGRMLARTTLAEAKRTLPASATREIYDWLSRREQALLRTSLPLPPTELRIRLVDHHLPDGLDKTDRLRHAFPLGSVCKNWRRKLRAAGLVGPGGHTPVKEDKNTGHIMMVPDGKRPLREAYWIDFFPTALPMPLDAVLRELSPRYRPAHR